MTISAWLFLAAIILEVVLVVVDLIVWRVYSNSMTELKREVQVYKAGYLTEKDSVQYLSTYVGKLSGMIHNHDIRLEAHRDQIDVHAKQIDNLDNYLLYQKKGENQCQH